MLHHPVWNLLVPPKLSAERFLGSCQSLRFFHTLVRIRHGKWDDDERLELMFCRHQRQYFSRQIVKVAGVEIRTMTLFQLGNILVVFRTSLTVDQIAIG